MVIENPTLTADDVSELRARAPTGPRGKNGTQALADICDVSTQTVRHWVNGHRAPSDVHVARMVLALNLPSRFHPQGSGVYIHDSEKRTLAWTLIGDSDEVTARLTEIKRAIDSTKPDDE